jgi:hypothetical protein
MKGFLAAIAALSLLVSASCSDDADVATDTDGGTSAPDDTDPAMTVYETTTTVLESPDHGPQLCLGGVAESYPPQCGGPDIEGWDWSAVEAESASGTTWGSYSLTGTWDGETFSLAGPVGPPDDSGQGANQGGPTDFPTPCEEPDGGWQVVDEATATDAGLEEAQRYAQSQPDFAGLWVDQSINPAAGDGPTDELAMNDPTKLVLNVRFTGDLDGHETELRQRFGGPLCVSEAERTEAELRTIQDEVFEELDGHYASTDIIGGVVQIGVVVAEPDVQAELDDTYGEGVVELLGALRPVDG